MYLNEIVIEWKKWTIVIISFISRFGYDVNVLKIFQRMIVLLNERNLQFFKYKYVSACAKIKIKGEEMIKIRTLWKGLYFAISLCLILTDSYSLV